VTAVSEELGTTVWTNKHTVLSSVYVAQAKDRFKCSPLHSKGQGVPQDYQQAAHWCREAAQQGHAPASEALEDLGDEE